MFGALATAATAAPKAFLVVDANTGATLLDESASEPRSPASLTKMMTLFLAFEALERGSVTMKTRIKISERAANASPSKLDLDAGDDIALEDAIKALITKSANDIAIAVAEHLGGSEDAFARLMTAKARELGMTGTVFKNASGLPDSGQVTTARDMVRLGLALYDRYPRQFGLFATRSFSYGGSTYKNHNTLMLHMAGVNGIKTGYTSASGFNLVTSYESDGRHLMAAIFGGDSASSRNAAMRVGLTRVLSRASTVKTRKPMLVALRQAPKLAARPPTRKAPPEASQPTPPGAVATTPTTIPRPTPVAAPPSTLTVAPAPRTPPPAAVATASEPPPVAPVLGPKVQIAKVRAVDAAPAAAVAQPTAPLLAQTAMAEPAVRAAPPIQPPAQQRAASPAAATPPPLAVPRPTPIPPAVASLPPAGVVLPPDAVGLGRAPSSLGEQHASLAASPAPTAAPTYRLAGPTAAMARPTSAAPIKTPQASPSRSGYEVQIGSFATAQEADRRLAIVQAQAGQVVGGYAPTRRTATVNGKTYERARFTGFDQPTATAACASLQQQGIACLVTRSE
jgi:D-alanyl-D-alanine carboxypeptidase